MHFNPDQWIPWVNRVAILLNFLSFWLVAPELIGEERLRKIEKRLGSGLVYFIPSAVWLSVYLLVATGTLFLFLIVVYTVFSLLFHFPGIQVEGISLYLLIVIFFAGAIFFANRSSRWAQQRLAKPLLTRLVNDDNARSRYLAMGIGMFILGHAIQMATSFYPPK